MSNLHCESKSSTRYELYRLLKQMHRTSYGKLKVTNLKTTHTKRNTINKLRSKSTSRFSEKAKLSFFSLKLNNIIIEY